MTALALVSSGIAFLDPVPAGAAIVTTTYNYTGGTQSWTVPAGVNALTVTLKGGQGGRGGLDSYNFQTPGGYQGVVTGTFAVTPGSVVTIAVGGGGGEGQSRAGYAVGGSAGNNPLTSYLGAAGGRAGTSGSSGGGGGSGAASVLRVAGVDIVAAGAGGNGGNGQFAAVVGRRAEATHTPRPDTTSTAGRNGMDVNEVCSSNCDGGGSGAGGGGAQGGDRGLVQFGGASNAEWFGFGGYPGANATAGFAGLTTSYDFYAGNNAPGSIVISYDTGAPGAPTGVSGIAQNGAVAVSWNAPGSGGSATVTDYDVYYATNPAGPYTLFAAPASSALTGVVTGLTNGTTYYFEVLATNSQGPGPLSTPSVGVVPSDVPAAPTVTAVVPFASGLYVDFTPGSTVSPITGYDYRLDNGPWLSAAVAANRVTISGLNNGQTYAVEIRARNAIGASVPSAPPSSGAPRDVAMAPSDVVAVGAPGSVALSWGAPDTNGAAITDYVVQTATSFAGPYTTFSDAVSASTAATVTGLTNGTTYFLRVAAVNAVGTGGFSTPVSATPFTTPSAPTISPVIPGNGALTVAFTPGSNGGSAVTAYEYQLNSAGAWQSTGSLNPFTIGGLTNGTTYTVTMRARNAAGNSSVSAGQSGTPRTVPAAPAIDAVALGSGNVSVAFVLGADGGSPVTNVEYSIDGGANWIVRSPASSASPLTITGLTGGTTYSVMLRAVNAAGSSGPSNASSVTALGTPGAPLINVTSGDRALTIGIVAPSNGGTPITNYEYSLDDGDTWTARTPASTATPLIISGLTNGTAYSVQLRAVNAVGSGTASPTTLATPATTPSAPTIDTPTIAGSGGALDVVFSPPASDGGSTITDYQYSTDAGVTWRSRPTGTTASPMSITTLSSDGTTPLTGGDPYPVEIRAVNGAGPGVASAVSTGITTTVPAAPTIDLVAAHDSSALVQFTAPANGGQAIMAYEYSLDGGDTWINTGSLSQEFVVSGLNNALGYTIVVRAVNSVGNGPTSDPETFQPFARPDAPALGAVTAGDQTLTVAFTAGSDGGSTILNYEYSTDGGATWRTAGTTASPLTISVESGNGAMLTNGTVYAVQLRAVNAAGSGAASASSLAAPHGAPSAPTLVSAVPGDGKLAITFTTGSDGGSPLTATEYQLNGGTWVNAGTLTSPLTIPGLTNGQSYSVAVRTVNAVGPSLTSTVAMATPRTTPGSPSAVSTSSGAGTVTVSWLAPASDGGSSITTYAA
ncbi:MAG: hypothetical protein QOD72_1778, partial [Acidimicrobiaceae bacterium]|nr:hypothetical protein [Acidimicrobiaceae bacterium]